MENYWQKYYFRTFANVLTHIGFGLIRAGRRKWFVYQRIEIELNVGLNQLLGQCMLIWITFAVN